MIKLKNNIVDFIKFPNNEITINLDTIDVELITTTVEPKLVIDFKFEDNNSLIELMLLKKYLNKIVPTANIRLVIWYMPYSRMDRSENGSPFTLEYISDYINQLNFNEVIVIEPHSDVTESLLNNSKSIFITPEIFEYAKKQVRFDETGDYVVFPDKGAANRYSDKEYAPKNLYCSKQRDFETGVILGLDLIGEVIKPNKAIIVDDLSSYGGTFVRTAQRLREAGFKEVYLVVAHAENSIFKGELFNHVDGVYTSDSMLTEHTHWENVIKVTDNSLTVLPVDELKEVSNLKSDCLMREF